MLNQRGKNLQANNFLTEPQLRVTFLCLCVSKWAATVSGALAGRGHAVPGRKCGHLRRQTKTGLRPSQTDGGPLKMCLFTFITSIFESCK
jgi:hypothetical protein